MKKGLFRSTHKNIFLLGGISFLNDVSSEMIAPILPLLINKLGGTGIAIGFIGGAREGLAEILKIVFGYLSDKAGSRKKFVLSGYIISIFFKFCLVLSQTWYHVLVFIGLERIGKGVRTAARDALISLSGPDSLGKSFGIHRSLDSFGAVLGSFLALIFLGIYNFELSTILLIAAIVTFFSLPPIFFIQDKKNHFEHNIVFSLSDFSQPFKIYLGIECIFAFANISYMFLIVKAQSLLNSSNISTPILLYVLFNLFYAMSAIPLGMLSDSIGRWKMALIGYTMLTGIWISFCIAQTITQILPLFVLYGLATSIIKVTQKAFVSDLSSPSTRATALGTFSTFTGVSTLLGSIITGVFWELTSPTFVFFSTACIATIAATLIFIFKKRLSG